MASMLHSTMMPLYFIHYDTETATPSRHHHHSIVESPAPYPTARSHSRIAGSSRAEPRCHYAAVGIKEGTCTCTVDSAASCSMGIASHHSITSLARSILQCGQPP
ncbi:uncharacterized protein TrAtP1_009870 [Trichoderma atroviride]|uniref:uncharacterized protein n=1 Tax=Hypocrea atroviridis TaxID=63577 RepID=UPI00331F3CB7|nr:hypothetical protein TrAtP1_009870 [Trichoderma atroviride]